MESIDPDRLLGLRDIAQLLGVHRDTPKTWRSRGLLPEPDEIVSGRPAWRASTIDAWWAERLEADPRVGGREPRDQDA